MTKIKIVKEGSDGIALSIKNMIRVSYFENNYTYGGLKTFDEFGDGLFLSNPKSNPVKNRSYIVNELNGDNPINDGKINPDKRAKKENLSFPFVVYIDIDFKSDKQRDTFNKDIPDKREIMNKFKKDKNIWISGNSKSGEGIRLYFIVYNEWAWKNKFKDYKTIYKKNANIILQYLKKYYNLNFYNKLEIDYIDRAPLNNAVLKTFQCQLNEYSNVNLDCNILCHNTELIAEKPIEDKNISGFTVDDLDYIEIDQFTHYNEKILATAKFADNNTRKLFYDKYKRYYSGNSVELKSFDSFCEFLNKKDFKYYIDFKKGNNIIDLINEPYFPDEFNDDYEDLSKSPIIPQKIYDGLPEILKNMCYEFNDLRERDIFLTSELAVLSSVLFNIKGLYHGDMVYPNINTFICAAPGSSKGRMKNSLYTIKTYIDKLKEEYNEKLKKYEIELMTNKHAKAPVKYKHRIGGNTSEATLYDNLENGFGKGLIFETEADAVNDANSKDWGNYSKILRSSFHHEPLLLERKTHSVHIEEPKLSLVLSGTPDQLLKLIESAQDGLFSRFIYYIYENNTPFLNPFKKNKNYKYIFENYSKDIFEIIDSYYYYNKDINLSDEQSDKFTDYFSKLIDKIETYNEKNVNDSLKRLGTVGFKILMVLSALRHHEKNGIMGGNYKIYDVDLYNMFGLMDVYARHMEIIGNNLKDKSTVEFKKNKKEILVNYILSMKKFKRSDIISKAKELGYSDATGDRILKNLKDLKKIHKIDRYNFTVL